jgi:hypothetical protein
MQAIVAFVFQNLSIRCRNYFYFFMLTLFLIDNLGSIFDPCNLVPRLSPHNEVVILDGIQFLDSITIYVNHIVMYKHATFYSTIFPGQSALTSRQQCKKHASMKSRSHTTE